MRLFVKDLYAILQEEMARNNGELPVECVQEGRHKTLYFHIVNWEERQRFVTMRGDAVIRDLCLPAFTLEIAPGKNEPEPQHTQEV